MSTKFADFLKEHQIDPRRVIAASAQLERLRPEDRALRLARRAAKKQEDGSGDEKKETGPKPRSGRQVTPRLITAASTGKGVSGPAKHRLLRAVNRILEQKKQAAVELRTLF
jgi:hypothetical protein